jgi:hypothetical protein
VHVQVRTVPAITASIPTQPIVVRRIQLSARPVTAVTNARYPAMIAAPGMRPSPLLR